MIISVYLIRKGETKFLSVEENGNINWVKNLDEASIYKTESEAVSIIQQKKLLAPDIYIYQIPYSVVSRKSKPKSKNIPKRKIKKRCK